MPSSSQIRNALAYMAVTVLVLVFLNIYSFLLFYYILSKNES